jgi:hypothetical protein
MFTCIIFFLMFPKVGDIFGYEAEKKELYECLRTEGKEFGWFAGPR